MDNIGQVVEAASRRIDVAPKSRTICVVEDEVFIRLALAEDLRGVGFRVIQAGNADEALTALRSFVPIDLVITDVRMPGSLDGIGLARQIKIEWPEIKVILLSAHLASIPADASADILIQKPYMTDMVIHAIAGLLSSHH